MAGSDPRKIPVVFYRTRGGSEVVRDWLRALDERDRNAFGFDLMRVQFRWPVGHAAVPGDGERIMGSADQPFEQPYRSRFVLRREGPRRGASRLHQEDPEDTRRRTRSSPQAEEGFES